MIKHTPGPWRFVAGDDYHIEARTYPTSYPHRCKDDDTGPYLATVYVATAGNRTADFGEANARLIAAAPDLLEAAKAAAEYCELAGADGIARLLRAAIAKGESA